MGQTFMFKFAKADINTYANYIWSEGVFGILSIGHLIYEPSIWLKVTSLASTASNRKGAKDP